MFRSKFFAHVASIAMIGGLFAPAALADDAHTNGEVRIGGMIDGVLTPADPADIAAATVGLPDQSSGEDGDVRPQLIDRNQWLGCFSLNHGGRCLRAVRALVGWRPTRCETEMLDWRKGNQMGLQAHPRRT